MELTPEIIFSIIRSEKEFPIDFDDAWFWIGYARKGTAKDALTANFQRGVDYEIFASEYSEAKKKGRGGHNRELIFLTADCFKAFSMMAGTQKGKEVRIYYLNCEKELKRRLEEERNQSKENQQKQLIGAMISPDVVSRYPKFPDTFYKMLFRMRGQGWEDKDPKTYRPSCVGIWTNKVVYDRMLGGTEPGGVKDSLDQVNPRRPNGTRKDRHHWHLKDLGEYHLNSHIYALMAISRTIPDGHWEMFMRKVKQAFPNDEVLQLSLWDIFEEMGIDYLTEQHSKKAY